MFWKQPKRIDADLGELTFSSGSWGVYVDTDYGSILASTDGDKRSIDAAALLQLKDILLKLDKYHLAAVTAIHADEFSMSWLDGANGTLELGNICSSKDPGKFSLLFGLTDWKDATINVDFNHGHIAEVWCND